MNARLDDEAIGRVVRRALEIESVRDRDGLDAEALCAAAAEVGIDPDTTREAIALERLGDAPDLDTKRPLDRVVGRSRVVVDRTIRAPVGDVVEQLDAWLTVGHHLRREVVETVSYGELDGASVEWAKRDDLAASLQRTARSMSGGAELGSLRRITAQLVPIDEHRSLARLTLDRRVVRRVSIAASGGLGGASIAGGAAAAAATATAPIAAAVVAPGLLVAGGVAVASRRRCEAIERDLRRLLDQIDAGDRPATIIGGVAQRFGLGRA